MGPKHRVKPQRPFLSSHSATCISCAASHPASGWKSGLWSIRCAEDLEYRYRRMYDDHAHWSVSARRHADIPAERGHRCSLVSRLDAPPIELRHDRVEHRHDTGAAVASQETVLARRQVLSDPLRAGWPIALAA